MAVEVEHLAEVGERGEAVDLLADLDDPLRQLAIHIRELRHDLDRRAVHVDQPGVERVPEVGPPDAEPACAPRALAHDPPRDLGAPKPVFGSVEPRVLARLDAVEKPFLMPSAWTNETAQPKMPTQAPASRFQSSGPVSIVRKTIENAESTK